MFLNYTYHFFFFLWMWKVIIVNVVLEFTKIHTQLNATKMTKYPHFRSKQLKNHTLKYNTTSLLIIFQFRNHSFAKDDIQEIFNHSFPKDDIQETKLNLFGFLSCSTRLFCGESGVWRADYQWNGWSFLCKLGPSCTVHPSTGRLVANYLLAWLPTCR